MSRSLDRFAGEKVAALRDRALERHLVPTARSDGQRLTRDGRPVLSFSCNDYLGLATHPDVIAAAVEATKAHGAGAGASRLVTGNHSLYAALERRLARWKQRPAACVFGSGYLANAGIPSALVGNGDLILIDELAHSSLWTGVRLSRAAVIAFRHNDAGHVAELLTAQRGRHPRVLIVTEGVFSMDGDRAPLDDLASLTERHDAWLLADDAHDLGPPHPGVPLLVGTLSKALGSYGGFLAASEAVVRLMHHRARTLIYTTGLPPGVIAAALAALDIIERDPALLETPFNYALAFTTALGLPTAQSAIVPLIAGDAAVALEAQRKLAEEGFLVVAIRPPTVPENTARLRFTFSATHSRDDVLALAAAVRRLVPARA